MSITYTEKGAGLHAAVAAAGHTLWQLDGEWLSSDDAAVQAIIDAYDPLPPARLDKWREIQAERDRRKAAGVRVGGHRFHSDPESRIQQLGLVMMGASIPAGLQWKTLDSAFVTMTPTLAGGIFAATAASDQGIFAAAEAHRATVNAMSDLAAISAYDHLVGWPA